ncbi:glycoside hydrolase family 26 protein [Streptomyces sp. NPDC048496]|uniref:glycoside hydrolase family 26 protein n=1 Tax=Streptomyces sp. NPDC048496 TaxID=3365558 RepID=UPI0037176829
MTRSGITLAGCSLLAAALLALTGCSSSGDTPGTGHQPAQGTTAPQAGEADLPFDVRPLLAPKKKYFGVAREGAPNSMAPIDEYRTMVGKQPNLIEYYAAFGDGFDAKGVRNAWNAGALTVMSWEPFDAPLADIADGKSDAYLKKYAASVQKLNLPVAISFADEMNGQWEKWGTKYATPDDYVRAWRHIHNLFIEAGAANAIWVWSPNIINPVKSVDVEKYYPGDAYVDWVGMVGYFTLPEDNAFDSVFGPTIEKIRSFSKKPILILETAAEPGQRRREDIHQLYTGVKDDDGIIGFVWFDYRKRGDWRLSASPLALAEFKKLAADGQFGFDVREP